MAVMRKNGLSALFEDKIVMGVVVGVVALFALSYVIFSGDGSGDGDVDSPDPERRLAAINALAEQGEDEDTVRILHRMSNDTSPRVAMAATRAIGRRYRNTANRKALEAIVIEAKSGAARGAAAAALGECEDVDPATLTRMLAKDPDPMARAGAAKGLAKRRDYDDLPELLDALSDPDSRVRLWAITGIRKTTAMHFKYVAERHPSEQVKEIAEIRATIQRRKRRQ